MANLSFNIELTSAVDANRTLVSNIGRVIIKKLAVKFEGNEIMSVDDFDVLPCYRDLWKTKSEKRNAIRQGIIFTDGCTENCIKLRINAGNKDATNAQDKVHVPNFRGVAGSEDFVCATLPTSPLIFKAKLKIFVTLPS